MSLRYLRVLVASPVMSSHLETKEITDAEGVYSRLDDTALDKLNSLMGGDIICNEKNYFLEFFKGFIERVPEWGHETIHDESTLGDKRKRDGNEVVNLFWSQFTSEQNEKVLVVRKQNFGLCYLQAPVVLEHHLIAIASGCEHSSTIDIGKYQDFLLSGDKLLDFLLKDEGGNSQDALYEICDLNGDDTVKYVIPDIETFPDAYKQICEKLLIRVAEHPALVSTFRVFGDFYNSNLVSFSGRPDRKNPRSMDDTHSMVLIGARKSEGSYFFLLQNWWDGRYFIEVSGEYMYHCEAKITFVNKAITRKLEMTSYLSEALYAETSADASETSYER